MRSALIEPELGTLRKLAQSLAKSRVEPVSSLHFLAALALHPSPAKNLLVDRQLGSEAILQAARGHREEDPDLMKRVIEDARQKAISMEALHTGALHVLIALLGEPSSIARRSLGALRIDVTKLRSSAIQLGLGLRALPTPRPARDSDSGRAKDHNTSLRAAPPPGSAMQSPLSSSLSRSNELVASAPSELSAAPQSPSSLFRTAKPRGEIVPLIPRVAETKAVLAAAPEPEVLASEKALLTPSPLPSSGDTARAGLGSGFWFSQAEYPLLHKFGTVLGEGQRPTVIGRDAEVDQALDALCCHQANSVCLLGSPGVGKSSALSALAARFEQVDPCLGAPSRRTVVAIDPLKISAACHLPGTLGDRMKALAVELKKAQGRVLPCFDDFYRFASLETREEFLAEFKTWLFEGIACVITATPEEFRRTIDSDRALARHFAVIELEELSREEAFFVLRAVADRLGEHHGVAYSDDAVAVSVAWSVRYLPGRSLPDKAVNLLDLAGARARRRGVKEITPEEVALVVAQTADVPLERLTKTDGERLLKLEEHLSERVVGHEAEIAKVAKILRRHAIGLNQNRPIGTFLLLGPSGVGKTETAKAIAQVLFGSDTALTRLDMSEYQEAHSVARLIGAPPGYVGHDSGGQLTEAVKKRPYQAVLLDEVEKAHPDVLMTFLAAFDEGRLTDGRGKTVDFTNVVFFLTSNLGASEAGLAQKRVGFGAHSPSVADDYSRRMTQVAKDNLAPELYNRIDEVLAFRPLTRAEVSKVALRLLHGLGETLHREHGVRLQFDAQVVDHILNAGGYEPQLGARPLKRALARHIEAPLADELLAGTVTAGDTLLIQVEEGSVNLDVVRSRVSPPDAFLQAAP